MIRSRLLTFLSPILLLFLAGCTADTAEQEDGGRRLVATVSIPPQQWLLRQIAGDRVEVNCLLDAGADPENYEPSMRQLKDLQQSQVYFTLGGLPFEEALMERIAGNLPSLAIEDTSAGIERLADSCHGHHHDHAHHHHHDGEEAEGFDPHLWTSPLNCRIMAANMLRTLRRLDPEGDSIYSRRFLALDSMLTAADDSIRDALSGCTRRTFMVWHPSMGYFASDYGLRQISVQQEGKEVTPRQLADAIDLARSSHPTVVFYDIAMQGNETSLLSSDLQTPVCPLRLMDRLFLHQLVLAAKAIRENQR